MKIVFVLIISLATVFLGYLYFYLGGNKEVLNLGVTEKQFYLLGTSHFGSYHKINDKISKVESWAKNNNVPCRFTFGLYIDNPDLTDENRLRSEGGCISESYVYSDLKNIPSEFSAKKMENQKYLLLEFSGSPAIGPMKVYPFAEKWFAETQIKKKGPSLEIYEINGNKINTKYYFSIAQ